ncbi:hypothetical protein BC827DRAFT_1182413 [Russula dissimulans]|nr:hypothetical protein BC827DRAFT_1182413 [Russula dissimulans]
MSLVARTPALRQNILRSRVFAPSRGVHDYKHMPFNYEGSKAALASKTAAYFAIGFSIPFVAAYIHLKKAGAV